MVSSPARVGRSATSPSSATDGTLTFATTTASDGSVGRFALPAVNTPATYTITATLRGYGTEVIQVALGPGDQRTDLQIEMRAGVGSIIGRVTAGGAPLGGATLTVASSDDARTTTSLTDGDVGLYNFPQLEIPGTYTVTASAPGYITQTRLVDLAGNATDIDFDLVKTTATITGLVRSDTRGTLAGATIAVSRDNLEFAVLSAAAPQAGAFTIDDLPPGTYLVEFSRYDHAAQSQLITLAAGQLLDLGTITLTFTDVPVPPATGSINVSIVDSQANPLTSATVRILDISTRDVVAEIVGDASQSSFIFQSVPVGTYIIQAERRLYNTAEQRISVGLGPAAATIPMFLLGQVSGRVIDSLTDQQLTDYEVSVSRVNADGSLTLIERIQVPANKQPNAQGRIIWESSPNSLTTGRYRVEVSDAPPGYTVAPDQILDPNNPTGPVMEFVISPTQEDPIVLNDIEADKYPVLQGRILKPLLTTPATNEVDYAPLDDDTLVVTVTCPGASGPLTATLTDEIGATPGLDTYTLTPIELESAGALGSCVISVSATGFTTNSITLDPPLAPSDGTTLSDRFVNIAVARPAESLGGTVFWIDRGTTPFTPRAVDGVRVATEGPVIVGFDDSTTNTPDGEPVPILAVTPLQSTTSAGSWALDGQVFGESTYSFTDVVRFVTGRITVTIDETPPRAIVASNANTVVTDTGAGGVAVQLTPLDGRITGQVQIASVNPVRFDDARISATGPSLPTFTTSSTTDTYIIGARAGTWRTTVTMNGDLQPPDVRDYTLAANSGPTSNTVLVNPGAAVTLPTVSVIEHARAEVRVVDQNGQPISDNGVRPQITLTNGVGPPNPIVQTVDTAGSTLFRRLPFSTSNPTRTFVSFAVTVSMPGYDFSQTRVAMSGPSAGVNPVGSFFHGFATFPFSVTAGAKPIITITVPRFGSLNGNVVGRVGSATENVPVGTPGVTIQGRRVGVSNQFGQWRATDELFPAVVDPTDPNGFRISGPPGAYVIEIVHPDFDLAQQPPGAPICPQFVFCGSDLVPFDIAAGRTVYLIANTVDTTFPSDFVLDVKRVTVRVTAVTSQQGGSAIPGVDVTLDNALATPRLLSGETDGGGLVTFVDTLPGTVSLTGFSPSAADPDTHFPVIASLDIKRFASSGDGIVDIVIVMPPLGQQITGSIGAVNSLGHPIHLPPTVDIARSFTVPALDNDGAPANNDATDATVTPLPTPSVSLNAVDPPGTPVPYEFANIPAGVHQLTFGAETGYAPPTPNPRTVTVANGIPAALGQLDYIADDITVVVDVSSAGQQLTTATVRLTSPDVAAGVLVPTSAANGRYTFVAVPPEIADYTLTITDPLHADETRAVTVIPSAGPTVTVNVAMTGNLAQVTGLAFFDDTEAAGGTVPLTAADSVELLNAAGQQLAPACGPRPGPTAGTCSPSPPPGTTASRPASPATPPSSSP